MQIDWLTVAAQIVNFLVLIWLLQRFLYRPITNAMARREARIEERLSDAKDPPQGGGGRGRKTCASSARSLRTQGRRCLKRRAPRPMSSGSGWSRRSATRSRKSARPGKRRSRRNAPISPARCSARPGTRCSTSRARLLAEFTSAALDDQIAQGFVAKLKDLDADTRKKMTAAADGADGPALVESACARCGCAAKDHPRDPRAVRDRHRGGVPGG